MNTQYKKEKIKNVYHKSVRLLNDANAQLDLMREVISKMIAGLASNLRNDDRQVDTALSDMKSSVESDDMDLLNEKLDYLLTILDRSKRSAQPSEIKQEAASLKVQSVLIELLNSISLANEAGRKKKKSLLSMLDNPENDDDFWNHMTLKVAALINENIDSLHHDNKDLQGFFLKINEQLVDIKAFMKQSQQDRKETTELSSALEASVDSCVNNIQSTVSSAHDIDDLKQTISQDLDKIRLQVKENKVAAKHREELSSTSFTDVVEELENTQGELADIKMQLQETKNQLLRDTLTGMYNRLAYEDRIEVEVSRSLREKTPMSIAMWDIDHFKHVNDEYGHDVGDRVLKAFSEVICDRIRKTDMLARLGGEEFVLLMPKTSAEQALLLNNTLREMFAECRFSYYDAEFSVTSSVGIAEYMPGESHQDTLKNADTALYKSKAKGRNRCTIYDGEMGQGTPE